MGYENLSNSYNRMRNFLKDSMEGMLLDEAKVSCMIQVNIKKDAVLPKKSCDTLSLTTCLRVAKAIIESQRGKD